MKFSASLIKNWMNCPLQVKFDNVSNLPRIQNAKATFGSCVHDALHVYHTEGLDIERTIKRFKYTWEHPQAINSVPDVWPQNTTYGGLRKKGLDILNDYHTKNKWRNTQIVAVEYPFCVPIGDHQVSGLVDLITLETSSRGVQLLKIIDFKTNTVQPKKFDLMADIQFTTYVYASLQKEFWTGIPGTKYVGMEDGLEIFEALQETARRAVWYHLWTNKEIDAGNRDERDFMRLYRAMLSISEAVEKDVYVPNIGANCQWCSYTSECGIMYSVIDKINNEEIGSDDDLNAL